jgi:hypothetical protein
MKRSASLSWLLDRNTPWLYWWQELILNWVSSWGTISTLLVVNADGTERCEWDLPTDVEIARSELEELLEKH